MKKTILTIGTAAVFVFGTLIFTGCGSPESEQGESQEEHVDGDGHEHAAGEEHEHAAGEEEHSHNAEHDHGDGHSHEHTASTEKIENTTEFTGEKVKDLSLIIDSYLQLKNALVNDDSKEAAVAAVKMLSSFNGFDKTSLGEDQAGEYAEIEESAVENAEHITRNADVIDHQREHLVVLSEDINDLITLIGTDQKLYVDFCAMANNNKGAIWLSETKDINNPYMGSEKPACGEVQKEIN